MYNGFAYITITNVSQIIMQIYVYSHIMTLFCMVSTLLRADMSPESRLVGEGETTVIPREVPGESYQGGGDRAYVGGWWYIRELYIGLQLAILSTILTLTTPSH